MKELPRVKVHVVTSQLLCLTVTFCPWQGWTEQVHHVLPERQRLQALGSHSVLCRYDLTLGTGVLDACLLLAEGSHRDERIWPHDGDVAARGALTRLLVTGKIRITVVDHVAMLRLVANEALQ